MQNLIVNTQNEVFNSEKYIGNLSRNNAFAEMVEEIKLELNEAEFDYFDKIVDLVDELENLFLNFRSNSVIDSRDIIEKLEAIDEVIDEAKEHNENYIGDFSDYDSIEEYTNLILVKGVSEAFLHLIVNGIDNMKENNLKLDELKNYVSDWEGGSTLWLESDFNAIDYLDDLGFFSNLEWFIRKHIDTEGLKKEITTGTYEIFGITYITV